MIQWLELAFEPTVRSSPEASLQLRSPHACTQPPSRPERGYLGLADARTVPRSRLLDVLPSRRGARPCPRTAGDPCEGNVQTLPGPRPVPQSRAERVRAVRDLGWNVRNGTRDARPAQTRPDRRLTARPHSPRDPRRRARVPRVTSIPSPPI